MSKRIKITCLNNNLTKEYELGLTLKEIADDLKIKLKHQILGARVNNRVSELSYRVYNPKIIEFFDITNVDGSRMYKRSLSFVLLKAFRDTLPDVDLRIEHSISKGFYCQVEPEDYNLSHENVFDIADRMREIINADLNFFRNQIPTDEAIDIFKNNKLFAKAKLFKTRPTLYTSVYTLDNQDDYFYGHLLPSTGYLKTFDLIPYYKGMLLRFPLRTNPNELGEIIQQEQLFEIFQEYQNWVEILEISTVGNINEKIQAGKAGDLIKFSEALHEKKVSQIADKIKKHENTKIILIAGPTSSGKTTFAKRLSVQLKIIGIKPIQISLDNYFVNRKDTPLDKNGEYDYECLQALDTKLFNKNLLDLIEGKEIEVPKYSFETGERFYDGKKLQISKEHIIIVEGIHGLNPELSAQIDDKYKFKIYISALTQIGIDWHNRIPTTDNRLLRRIIRDYKYRNYSASETLRRWQSVRRGEERNIFPFQEEADIMFNSALLYELSVIKKYAKPLLKEINETEYEYSEAQRLLKFLSYFVTIEEDEIPPTSILREFLSGSSFKY